MNDPLRYLDAETVAGVHALAAAIGLPWDRVPGLRVSVEAAAAQARVDQLRAEGASFEQAWWRVDAEFGCREGTLRMRLRRWKKSAKAAA